MFGSMDIWFKVANLVRWLLDIWFGNSPSKMATGYLVW